VPEEDDVLQESDVEPHDKGIAAQAAAQAGVMAAQATVIVDKLLAVGIDGRGPFESAQNVADGALSGHGDAEKAIDTIVRSHVRAAAAGGFVTGLGGFFTLPLALPVNLLEFYAIATRMVAAVACLRGYDLRQQGVRSAVLLTLVGADADDLLRGAGVQHSGRLAGLATSRLPGPALMVLNKGIGFRLVARVGRSAAPRLGKGVPIVGGLLGAGFDVFLLRRIADQARHEFPHAPAALGR
jgi:hypothetical protein